MGWKVVVMPFGNSGSRALQNAFEAVYVGKERPPKAAMFGNLNAVASGPR